MVGMIDRSQADISSLEGLNDDLSRSREYLCLVNLNEWWYPGYLSALVQAVQVASTQ